jgi:hypothetical protein
MARACAAAHTAVRMRVKRLPRAFEFNCFILLIIFWGLKCAQGFFLAATHVGGVISFGAGAISFTHVLKATEPVWSALILALFFKEFLPVRDARAAPSPSRHASPVAPSLVTVTGSHIVARGHSRACRRARSAGPRAVASARPPSPRGCARRESIARRLESPTRALTIG